MKKAIAGILTMAMMAVLCWMVIGEEVKADSLLKEGDYFYDVVDGENQTDPGGGYVRITAYDGNSKNVQIPEEIADKEVRAIGNRAFYQMGLTSVTFPSTIFSIGESAFYGNQLTGISLPGNLKEIGRYAFGNNQLTGMLQIPSGVTEIGTYAFADNQITQLGPLPSGLTTIQNSTFYQNRLTEVTIPVNITKIDTHAFYNNDLTRITLNEGLTEIGFGAFIYNRLDNLSIPTTVKNIGAQAFQSNHLTKLEIPSGVESIGSNAFSSNRLFQVEIHDGIETVGVSVFSSNANLNTVLLPESVRTIDYLAFGATMLDRITIGSDVNINTAPSTMGENMGFRDFYNSQRQAAGTYHYIDGVWIRQQGDMDEDEEDEENGRDEFLEFRLDVGLSHSQAGTVPQSRTYPAGATVNLTAEPEPGWMFDRWNLDGVEHHQPEITFTMDSNRSATAYFREILTHGYSLSLAVEGQGTLQSDPIPGEEPLEVGTEVILTASPEDGWRFVK